MEEYGKVSMTDQIAIAVASPKNYKELTHLKPGKTVAFVILLTFILTFIQTGIGVLCFLFKIGGFENLFMNKIPDFVYENGSLTMDNEMELVIGTVDIYVNTEQDVIHMEEMENDGIYITIGKKSVIFGAVNGSYVYEQDEYPLSMLFPSHLDNKELCTYIPGIYFAIIISYIGSMIGTAAKWLFFALIFSIMGRAAAANLQTGLYYGDVYRICIYGQSLGLLLSAVNMAVGYFVPATLMFLIMIILSFVFINRGIISHVNFSEHPPGSM